MAESGDYDAIVLDVMLPGMDGLTLLKKLREKEVSTSILMLTARDTVENRVEGLKCGASDYLIKPFAMDELVARVDALCRRSYNVRGSILDLGHAKVNLSKRQVSVSGVVVELKPREYRIVEYMAMRSGEVVSKMDIESWIYDDSAELRSNVVESAISSIRRKFAAIGQSCPIETRRGLGYIIDQP